MRLQGPQHINCRLKLNPGDRFRVCVYYNKLGAKDTPNSNGEMARLTGEWLTVNDVRETNLKSTSDGLPDGYIHTVLPNAEIEDRLGVPDIDWNWHWYHMDRIDRAALPELIVLSGELPNI